MKTTVELPDDLIRQVKILAAREDRKLKEVLAELIERGLSARSATGTKRRRPRPISLPGGKLTDALIESGISKGRD